MTLKHLPPANKHIHLFFMDGVGLGDPDPAINPFVTAHLPHLTKLLGPNWYLKQNNPIITPQASLIPTDATLGVPGKPQSATGQATILTGRNIPQLIGQHYGPKPNPAIQALIQEGTLFQQIIDAGGQAALITPYPQQFFQAIQSGKRLLSAIPLAVTNAGIPLMTAQDLQQGRAISPGFTGAVWHQQLGYQDIPQYTLPQAGRQIATIAQTYHFSLFEHWPSDHSGHRGSLTQAKEHLEMIDAALGGILEAWDYNHGLLIITSDHGNIEEKNHRNHTYNPVPTILIGPNHQQLATHIHNLTDIAPLIRHILLAHPQNLSSQT